ncbi:MAG: hypothetical protein ACRDNF_08605 [Streptosporangiaceae bacterium]
MVAFLAIVAGIAGTFVGVIAGRKGDPWHDDAFVTWVVVLIIAGASPSLRQFLTWQNGSAV